MHSSHLALTDEVLILGAGRRGWPRHCSRPRRGIRVSVIDAALRWAA